MRFGRSFLVVFVLCGLRLSAIPVDDEGEKASASAQARSESSDAEYKDAIAALQEEAKAGSADAEFSLGEIFRLGAGAKADPAQAVKWYRVAAAQDHVDALVKLSEMLRDPDSGVPSDYIESLRLARHAVELGSIEAMSDVGDMLRAGQGTARDPAGAAKLYEQAAARDNVHATEMLGWMHMGDDLGHPDFTAARTWFEKAGQNLSASGMRALGSLYADGKGGAKDPATAFLWFERSAREGDGSAQNTVGWMLREGIGIERDDEEAVNWFRLAVKNGEPMGEANLGFHAMTGRGVPRDAAAAVDHLIAAGRSVSDSRWLEYIWHEAFKSANPTEQPSLRRSLQQCLDDPRLMQTEGELPEMCLLLLEGGPKWVRDPKAVRKLLEQLKQADRRQAHALLAAHAFYGQYMAYDLALARREAEAAQSSQPADAKRILAMIDSAAADTPAARANAEAVLRRLAEDGDRAAALLVSTRLLTGIVEKRDVELARKYHGLAVPPGKEAQASFEKLAQQIMTSAPVDPSPEEIAARVSRLLAQRGDTANFSVTPVYRVAPFYPYELRLADLEGRAMIDFVVAPDGVPVGVFAKESTHPLFARAAEAAVARWRFAPGRKNGKAIAVHLNVPIIFQLHDEDPPAGHTDKASEQSEDEP